jgi:hypothetical protein
MVYEEDTKKDSLVLFIGQHPRKLQRLFSAVARSFVQEQKVLPM